MAFCCLAQILRNTLRVESLADASRRPPPVRTSAPCDGLDYGIACRVRQLQGDAPDQG